MENKLQTGTQSIERTVEILKRVGSQNTAGITLAEIARQAKLNTSTAHRILGCLVKEGLLMQKGSKRAYFLGMLTYELGLASNSHFNLQALCSPVLNRLARLTGDTVFLTVRSGSDSVVIQRAEGTYPIKVLTQTVGERRPLGTTAGGVALLTAMPVSEREKIIATSSYRLHGYGKFSESLLKKVLERSIKLGYALNENDFLAGVTGVGVTVPNMLGSSYAALSVIALSERLGENRRNEVVEMIRIEAAVLAKALTDSDLN